MSATVLYIDDNTYMLDLISMILEVEGYTVLVASDGETGLSMALENHPDVVMVDIAMPSLSGHDVCQMIRAQSGFEDIPLIMFTTSHAIEDQLAARNNKVDEYLTKPCSREDLVNTLERIMQARSAQSNSITA